MDIEIAKEKLKNPNKKNLIDVIRIFKRNGIENYCIAEIETIQVVLDELEKKEAIINEMAEWINRIDSTIFCNKSECNDNCEECVIKEFTKKVEGK